MEGYVTFYSQPQHTQLLNLVLIRFNHDANHPLNSAFTYIKKIKIKKKQYSYCTDIAKTMRKRLQHSIEAASYSRGKAPEIWPQCWEHSGLHIYGPRRGPGVKGQRVGARGLGQMRKRKTGLTVPTEEGMWMERDS